MSWKFKKDLKLGKLGELLATQQFQKAGCKVTLNTSSKYSNLIQNDFIIEYKGITASIEVKYDLLSTKTKNLFFEVAAINHSSADFFVYVTPENNFFVFPAEYLKSVIASNDISLVSVGQSKVGSNVPYKGKRLNKFDRITFRPLSIDELLNQWLTSPIQGE